MPRVGALAALAVPSLVGLAAAASGAPPAPERRDSVEVYLTARSTAERLAKKASLTLTPLPQPPEDFPTVIVDPDRAFQVIEGIGGALTDAAAETFAKLPAARQEELLTAYFDTEKGLGYSLARTHIHSCDFSSESYTYDDVAGDTALEHFTIEHDRRHRIPFIKAALARTGGALKIFASPWSPPAWMKTNASMLHGGRLKEEYRSAWAAYFVRFVLAYRGEGIPIWGLTVQNEPLASQTWESCLFTAAEERDFVREHLGPALERAGLQGLRLMIWDHNRGLLYQRAKVVYDDPEASRFVWGAAFHWYVGDHWDNVRVTREAYPDKALLFTEGTPANFDPSELDDWKWGEVYGESMIRDLGNGAAGWTDWNVLLDERGGPNHVGNFCLAPVHGDTRTGELHYMSSYWYIGHLARFVRPGSRRVACTTTDDRLLTAAFLRRDGRV
ncbi:MAG TPA: glycosyl hydrolase, partial [Vicinamibacteria bacterium]